MGIPELGHLPRSLTATVHGGVSPGRFSAGSSRVGAKAGEGTPSESHYKAVQPCTKRLKSTLRKEHGFSF